MRCAKALTSCTKNGVLEEGVGGRREEGRGNGVFELWWEIRSCGSEVVMLVVVVVEGGVLLVQVGGCWLLYRV